MPLFDERERVHEGSAAHSDPTFRWLNRSAGDVARRWRQRVEGWFARYPEEHRPDLRGRYRSSDEAQHRGAAFELFLHEALLQLECEVTVHPELPGGTDARPDFLASPRDGEPFYLEATVATGKSDEERAADRRKARVYDLLDDLESPNFLLGLTTHGFPATDPATRPMRRTLREELAALDPDEVLAAWREGGIDAVPHWTFDLDGWRLDVFPIPVAPDQRGPGGRTLGMWGPGVARHVEPVEPIRDNLTNKAYGYGELDHPFVIAINAMPPFVAWDNVGEALFGTVVTGFTRDSSGRLGEQRTWREPNGLWNRGDSPGATHVSAVLSVLRLRTWNAHSAPVRVYRNPWAERCLEGGLDPLPQVLVAEEGQLTVQEGESLGNVMGIPAEWPSNEVGK